MAVRSSCRRFRFAAAALLGLLAIHFAAGEASAQAGAVPPIPPGQARLWFYRVFFPGDTYSMPAIGINGTLVGYGIAGTSFYRDVPAGSYLVTVESDNLDLAPWEQIAVAPGQEVYVQIASMPHWDENRGPSRRATYDVMLMPPRMAFLQMPATRLTGGY